MAKNIVSVIGYMNVDFFMTTERIPDAGESLKARSYTSRPGGKGGNSALAAFRTSHVKLYHGEKAGQYHFQSGLEGVDIEVRMIGRVGDDNDGRVAMQNLKENGVNIDGVGILPDEFTGVSFALIEAHSGENRLLFTTGATDRLLPAHFVTPESLGVDVKPDLVISQLEVRRDTVEQILRLAHASAIDVVLNAAPAQPILTELYRCITHLIVNETEAAMLYGVDAEDVNEQSWLEIAQAFLKDGARNVVITLGAQGAFYANSTGSGHVPAVEVKAVDVTGAGRVFLSGSLEV